MNRFLTRLLICALGAGATTPAFGQTAASHSESELQWFEGTWEEALAAASRQDKLVFVDFWADWCHWCKELDKRTFSDASVRAALDEMVLYSVDVETEAGAAISGQYSSGPMQLPSLLFVEADGAPRELIQGFLPAPDFLEETLRIQRDEGTLGALRRTITAAPDDLETRWKLSEKLTLLGASDDAEEQLAQIRARDPERRSLPLQRLDLGKVVDGVAQTLELAPLHTFLETAEHAEVRFRGWHVIAQVEEHLSKSAGGRGEEEARAEHWSAAWAARRAEWKHACEQPSAEFVPFAAQAVANSVLANREHCSDADLAFALTSIEKASEVDPRDAETSELMARLLFASGRQADALGLARRWEKNTPEDARWKRLVEFFSSSESPKN